MAIKKILSQEEFDKLDSDALSALGIEYELGEDGKYHYQDEDFTSLRNVADHEKNKRKDIQKRMQKLLDDRNKTLEQKEREMRDLQDELDSVNGNFQSIKDRYEQQLKEKEEIAQRRLDRLRKQAADREVDKVATDLFGEDAPIFRHLVEKRIVGTLDDDENSSIKVLDANGAETDLTLDQLVANLKEDKSLQRFIAASNASGGGSNGQGDGGGAAKTWGEMNADERIALKKSDPDAYNRLKGGN
jgi:hypothetical protein